MPFVAQRAKEGVLICGSRIQFSWMTPKWAPALCFQLRPQFLLDTYTTKMIVYNELPSQQQQKLNLLDRCVVVKSYPKRRHEFVLMQNLNRKEVRLERWIWLLGLAARVFLVKATLRTDSQCGERVCGSYQKRRVRK